MAAQRSPANSSPRPGQPETVGSKKMVQLVENHTRADTHRAPIQIEIADLRL
jgi:hypothetical protein